MIKSILTILLISLTFYTKAQFGNIFEQFFNQGGEESHHQQQQQHHHETVSSTSDKIRQFSEKSICSNYLCPTSFECVSNPTDCPCPDLEDIKCLINDSFSSEPLSFFCTRSPGCSRVQEALKLGIQ